MIKLFNREGEINYQKKKKTDNTAKKQLIQQNKYSRLKQRQFSTHSEGLVLATIKAILPL